MKGQKFNHRKQESGESIDSFITSLYNLTEHCDYGALSNDLVRDILVVGIRDEQLSVKLQIDATLSLKKATKHARKMQ